jgi:hypothetical protein
MRYMPRIPKHAQKFNGAIEMTYPLVDGVLMNTPVAKIGGAVESSARSEKSATRQCLFDTALMKIMPGAQDG